MAGTSGPKLWANQLTKKHFIDLVVLYVAFLVVFCYNRLVGEKNMRHAVAQVETYDLPLSVARASMHTLAQELQDVLTQRLAAYIVGLSDGRDIGRYARKERKPHPGTDAKIRELSILVSIMKKKETPETIQIWFQGRNPDLGDRSPASLLHEDFNSYRQVKNAVEKFLATGE